MSVPNDNKTEPTRICYGLQQKLTLRAVFEFLLALSDNLLVVYTIYVYNIYKY